MTTKRSLDRFAHQQHTLFKSIEDFLHAESVPAGILTINYNGSPLDLLNLNNGAPVTTIMFHAALSNSVKSLPVFSGLRVLRGLKTNVICVSDPTLMLDPKLRLAWFAGSRQQPLQRDLPSVIRKIISSHATERTIFFGASGGGFASLYYSSFETDSLAIVLNPQTVIRAYTDTFVLAYARAAFGAKTLEQARSYVDRAITGDLRHRYRGGFSNTVAYVQNYRDTAHIYRHAKSFLDAIPSSERLHLRLGDWGNGHLPPPPEVTRSILETIIQPSTSWNSRLKLAGFMQSPASADLLHARQTRYT